MGSFLHDWNLNELLVFGMADYYQNEIKSGKTQNQAIQNTASQYRVTQKTVVDNLNQNKKKTPNSFEKLLKHWDELVTKNNPDQQEIDAFRDEGIRLIDKMRIKDKDKIKEMFNNSIDDFMANLSLSQPHNAINNNPCDFRKALNNFAKAVYNSREERDARERIKEETKEMGKYYFGKESKGARPILRP